MNKKTSKTAKKSENTKKRQIEPPRYRSFRLSKKLRHETKKSLPGAFTLMRRTVQHLRANKKLFLGIVFLHLFLSIVLVRGLGFNSDIPELKSVLDEVFTGGSGQLVSGVAVFSFLIGAAGSTGSDVGSVYQTFLLVIVSLALIWGFRQTYANKKVSVKETFYKGMYPFIPFVLVLLVMTLQLIPFAVGTTLFSIVSTTGLAVGFLEQAFWVVVFSLFALLSLYMLSSSLFAVYIVTLSDMQPMQALRSARGLVLNRRFAVMKRVLLMPLLIIIAGALIMIPIIIFVTPVAEWLFFMLSILSLAVIHGYLYTLYRELL